MQAYPLFVAPTFQSRIWGGSRLQSWYDTCPQEDGIGEAWILSDHPDGLTTIANGPYEGKTISTVMQAEPEWFGQLEPPFPLLFKVIDAASDLSVQVHPDDEYGHAHAGEQGKTECWWVLDTEPHAKIVYGHHAPSRAALVASVEAGRWGELLKEVETTAGDFWFVPSGKLHALGAGTMVLEVQQSSNTTYRVYDYDRVDANGKQRELHLADALNVTTVPDATPVMPEQVAGGIGTLLAECQYFRVERWQPEDMAKRNREAVHVVAVADGSGTLTDRETGATYQMNRGAIVLLPRSVDVSFSGKATLIATTVPTR